MHISNIGLDLVRHFEGCHLAAYKCPAGIWTIGVGRTGQVDGKPITEGMQISQEMADRLLAEDMIESEQVVNSRVIVRLEQHEFDALVSFVFNVGAGAFTGSTLRKRLNEGKYKEASAEFDRWVHGGGKVLPGLVRRRAAERHLFETGQVNYFDHA